MFIVKSTANDVSSLGAAMMAGQAKGINVWDLNKEQYSTENVGETFMPSTSIEGKFQTLLAAYICLLVVVWTLNNLFGNSLFSIL